MNEKVTMLLPIEAKPTLPHLVKGSWRFLVGRQEVILLILLLGVGTFLSLRSDTFLTAKNLFNVTRAFSWIAIAAFGQSIVIIIGGIDLSVGAVMALAGLTSAFCLRAGMSVSTAILAGLLSGALIGWFNGMVVSRFKLPPFIVTLGTMSIVRGILFGLTGGWPIRDLPQEFRSLGQYDLPLGSWFIPIPVLFMLGLAVLVSLLLGQTVLGNYIYTLGNNERAMLVAGINIGQIKVLVYTMCGLLTAFAGLLLTARLGVAAPTTAVGYELDIIAAAIFGGASLFGGKGNILGVLLGAAIMQMLRNGLVHLGFLAHWQAAAIGALILVAILLDYWRRQQAWH